MALVLNTNISSLVAQNSLSASGRQLSSSLQQLSSGLRINTAADDAAGYAIVQGMTSQINGINQAARNANDGVSLAQTAAGALSGIINDLQTMRSLAVQSLNASNSPTDRADLDAQFQQLKADINSVASQTQFNGVNLLDGTFQGATFQVGANAGQSITMSSIASTKANNLGALFTAAATPPTAYTSDGTSTGTAVAKGDAGTFTLTVGSSTFTTSQVTLTGNQATDNKTIAAAINQAVGSQGVVATVNANGTGIDLSSTTSQTVGVSYAAAGTGTETLATFGLQASNTMGSGFKAAAAATGQAGATFTTNVKATDTATFSVKVGATTYTTAAVTMTGTQGTDVAAVAAAINTAIAGSGAKATVNANNGIDFTSNASTTVDVATGTVTGTGSETIADFGLSASTTVGTAVTAVASGTMDTANVLSVDNANQVLIQVDAALQQIVTASAQLGAYQNRFQAAVTGLNTTATNLSSARSQIQDTDYAQTTAALSKAQILQQASTAMVAQANTIPQNILSLLQKLP